MRIHYITPFATDKNIGKEYNARIKELPDDCYIVLRDGDTLFMNSDWGNQIADIIKSNPNYQIIGAMTNRLGVSDQLFEGKISENSNINYHINIAEQAKIFKTLVRPTNLVAAMCMIFHKSIWDELGGFKEDSIFFDKEFCKSAIAKNMNIGVALGLYIFHLYRWGQDKPQFYKKHLLT